MIKKKIYTNSKTISLAGGQPVEIWVPDTTSAEYKEMLQDEYYFRTYYQAVETISNKNGYVFFDTLTYADNHLPHISDFCANFKDTILDYPCFSLDHYRKFMVLLRRKLSYRGFNVKDNLKYFLCSEYGTDPTKTHRPHYHVLFFVTDPKLSPTELAQAIADSWPYGRTDNYYSGMNQIKKHTYRNDKDRYCLNVLKYVSDYVTKCSAFEAAIENRLKVVMSKLHFKDDDERKRWRQTLKRHMCQFHRQSQGYGVYGLLLNNKDEMFSDGTISMPDPDCVVKHIPMPLYFQRKLFYNLTKDFRGNKKWQLTDEGIDFKLNMLDKSIENTARKFEDWRANLPEHATVNEIYDVEGHHRTFTQGDIDGMNMLYTDWVDVIKGERSWRDFATYILVYKGRVKTPQMINNEQKGLYYVPEAKEFYKKAYAPCDDDAATFFNFTTANDVATYKTKFISKREPREGDDYLDLVLSENVLTHAQFVDKYVINDKSDPRFAGFDRLYSIYVDSQYFKSVRKDKVFNKTQELTNLYKKFK